MARASLEGKHPELTVGSDLGHVVTHGGPLVIGMMLHTFFNLVDFFICARLGPDAINAVGICDII
jgi:Na+-driven multidrug efflux pump